MCARPLGSLNKPIAGMAFKKRLNVLQKIALDTNEKASDRISAIKQISDLLNDRIKNGELESPVTTIKFTEDTGSNITKVKEKIEKKQQDTAIEQQDNTIDKDTILPVEPIIPCGNIDVSASNASSNVSSEVVEDVPEDSILFDFCFEEDNEDSL